MKISQTGWIVLAVLIASLSFASVAQADWEMSGVELVYTGPNDALWTYGLVDFSEGAGPGAGVATWSIADRYSYFGVHRDRRYRTYFTWTGSGSPTLIDRVQVGWSVTMNGWHQDTDDNLSWEHVALGDYGSTRYEFQNYDGMFSDAGSFTTSVVMVSPTVAYVELNYLYDGSTYPWDGPGTGGGSVGVTISPGLPYDDPNY